jgi:hypothetical protein
MEIELLHWISFFGDTLNIASTRERQKILMTYGREFVTRLRFCNGHKWYEEELEQCEPGQKNVSVLMEDTWKEESNLLNFIAIHLVNAKNLFILKNVAF